MIWRIENLDQPEKPDKGFYGGSCNRRACQAPGATWFNKGTERYYCSDCARILNRANHRDSMRLFGGPLCVPGEHLELTGSLAPKTPTGESA